MVKTTRWAPDTCGCSIEYIWETTATGSARVHVPFRAVRICESHRGAVDVFELAGVLTSENQRKNDVLALLEAEGFEAVSWGWSEVGRVLELDVPGITSDRRMALQEALGTAARVR